MYLIYVDESGDPGLQSSPSSYFILSGIVLHELRWNSYLEQIIGFRRRMQGKFGLRVREEIHAAAMINNPGNLVRIKRNDRLAIIRAFADELGSMHDINIINIVVEKNGKPLTYDVFSMAWKALIQRFQNTITSRNFPGPMNPDERGVIFSDTTNSKKLTQLLRQMRRYNPLPQQPNFGLGYRNIPITSIIEDPSFRNSDHSYFIQTADLAAYLLLQRINPNSYMYKKGGHNYFLRLDSVVCKVAAINDPHGIVWL